MKAVIQRVKEARVIIDGRAAAEIGRGILLLLGVEKGDTEEDVDYIVKKVSALRIFQDAGGKMNLSLRDTGGSVLLVSQFTLAADCGKGTRPSFDRAEEPRRAGELYEKAAAAFRAEGIPTQTGVFGASMEVGLVNDGPVTIVLERRTGHPVERHEVQ